MDPIEHYYQSPYVGFDSNPVFYADPTGTSSIKLEGQAAQDFFGALKDEVANKRTDEYRKYFQQVQEDVGGTRMALGADGVMNLSCGCLTPPCPDASADGVGRVNEKKYNFNPGKSPFKLTEIIHAGGGEGVSGSYGELRITASEKAPDGLAGQEISADGLSIGFGVGLPLEIMAGTVGTIYLNQQLSGNNLEDIFNNTGFVTVQSFSALLKFTTISAYDNRNMNNLLWTANLFGGGVSTASFQASRSTVNFKEKK